ncbi:MAG: hypothetical protein ACRD30_00535, partial [Bryobacteraceae bacterium]
RHGSRFAAEDPHARGPGRAKALSVEGAMRQAMDEILGGRAEAVEADYRKSWATMPCGEAMILWMRQHLPGDSGRVFARAREIYAASPFPQ